MSADPKVMLITGTRTGIGAHLARHYLSHGYLVEGCSRGEPEWEAPGYHHHRVDVADEPQVKEMVSEIRRRHGRLDVAINNAAVASMNHVLLTPGATGASIMAANFQGTFLVCREAAKLMQRGRWGRIVNFGSVAVPMTLDGEAIYAASKSAVVTFTKILAREVAAMGITCNVVAPSPVDTDLIRGVQPEKIRAIIDRLAIKRAGRYEDVVNVVDFFIRPESDYVTGQVIYLGGAG